MPRSCQYHYTIARRNARLQQHDYEVRGEEAATRSAGHAVVEDRFAGAERLFRGCGECADDPPNRAVYRATRCPRRLMTVEEMSCVVSPGDTQKRERVAHASSVHCHLRAMPPMSHASHRCVGGGHSNGGRQAWRTALPAPPCAQSRTANSSISRPSGGFDAIAKNAVRHSTPERHTEAERRRR